MITAGFLISLSGVSAGIGLAVAALGRTATHPLERRKQETIRVQLPGIAAWD